MRRLALAGGVRRLAVRSRPGTEVTELVVAYPWRNSARAEMLADGVAAVLDAVGADDGADVAAALLQAAERLAATPPGSAPELIKPRIPVVAVTGTNGKTTTSRMLGFIAQRAGLSVGWSSTDGVYLNGELVEAGDYSGPSGAGQVLRQPGVQLAVTETARGGILRRGVGVAWNDVSVVTNISADHLGIGGIETLDQLAEVKAVITKITRPTGWCVLNGDDPRTFAMRLGTKARVWVFTLDPNSPAARAVIDDRGRVTTVIDGWVAVLQPGVDALPVVPVVDVGMTLAGLSRVNIENTLAVTSAALAIGLSAEQVADGLRAFDPGEDNPGRMNVWTLPVADGQATTRGRDQRGDRPGPQRGRPAGADRDRAGDQAVRRSAADRRRHGRRPHRRRVRHPRGDRRAGRRRGRDRAQGRLPAGSADERARGVDQGRGRARRA